MLQKELGVKKAPVRYQVTWEAPRLGDTFMKPWNVYSSNCPTRLVLDRVGDKWAVLVLGLLASGPIRFNELRRRIEGVSQKMLSQTLKSLERDGLVNRKATATVP